MKKLISLAAAVAALSLTGIASAAEPAGEVDFGHFAPAKAGQFVEIDVGKGLLNFAAVVTGKQDPEIAELLQGLKRVRVNVVTLDESNREDAIGKLGTLRSELAKAGWEKIVTVKDNSGKGAGDDVMIFSLMREDGTIDGLVVTVIGADNQAVVVNVVGSIKPEQVARLGEKLNIEPLKKIGDEIKG